MRTRGTVLVGTKRYKLPRVKKTITVANRTVVIVVPLSSSAKKKVASALKRRRTALASISLSARAPDGTSDSEGRRARLIR